MTVATEMPSTATYLKEKFCCLIFSKNVTKGISYSSLEIFEASTKLNGSRSFAQVYQDHLLLGDRHLRSLLKIAACAIARGPSAALFRISVRKLLMVKFPGPRAGFQGQFPPKFTLVPVGRVVGHTIDRCITWQLPRCQSAKVMHARAFGASRPAAPGTRRPPGPCSNRYSN